jgi:alpha-galactosidase
MQVNRRDLMKAGLASLLPRISAEVRSTNEIDVTVRNGAEPRVRFRSGNLVYEEHLHKGGWRTRYWSPAGLIKPDELLADTGRRDQDLPPWDGPIAGVFGLSIDGQELWDDWQFESADDLPENTAGIRHSSIKLRHTLRPVRVVIHTELTGHPFLKRWIDIRNDGKFPAAVGSAYPMSGCLFAAHRLRENAPDASDLFSVLRPAMFDPVREDDFRWYPLPDGSYRYGASKWGTPFAIVKSNITGESFLLHFGWSGNYTFEFFNDNDPSRDDAWLYFRVGLAGPGPFRVLAPGESAVTPPVYLGHFNSDLDSQVQALHSYLRSAVLPPLPSGRVRPVEINSWGFVADEISEESLKSVIDTAADVGVELFTIDAGWYGDVGSRWPQLVGDWKTGTRLPHGLEPVFDYARQKGLLCGLWVDIERIGLESQLRKSHPDWPVAIHGQTGKQTALDFTKPEVVKFAEETLANIINRYQLDVFRLDFNAELGPSAGQSIREGFEENTNWRHYEAIYAMYGRLRRRFPRLMMENCASGGGRNDLGMLQNFQWTQVSDEWGGVRTLKILNGFSLAFPPEYGLSYVGFMSPENYRYGDTDFRFRGQMFGHLCLGGIVPAHSIIGPEYQSRVRHHVSLYKSYIRPVLPTVKVYHHTPLVPNTEPGEWIVLEHAAADRSRAYAGVFRLAGARDQVYLLRPRGLSMSKEYRLTFDNSGESVKRSGFELSNQGIEVAVRQILRSELLLFEAET